jgi:hypothetical protein
VSVKGYVNHVDVVGDGAMIATHLRNYERGQKILDPLHFLGVLARKPAALDHAPVYRDWQLPAAFAALRRTLEARLGSRAGANHYIRVLQLLTNHSIEQMENVITGCLTCGNLDADIVIAAARRQPSGNALSLSDNALSLNISAVTVRPPDLAQFDRLLSHSPRAGVADACRDHTAVVEGQPEATEVADDVGRVGEVGP